MKKKIAFVFVPVFTICIAGMIAFNSAKTPSNNKEGIVELTGPVSRDSAVKKGEYTVTTMGFRIPGSNKNNEK